MQKNIFKLSFLRKKKSNTIFFKQKKSNQKFKFLAGFTVIILIIAFLFFIPENKQKSSQKKENIIALQLPTKKTEPTKPAITVESGKPRAVVLKFDNKDNVEYQVDENATSYDDDLITDNSDKDQNDDETPSNTFHHTVVANDNLINILQNANIPEQFIKALLNGFSELKNIKPDQQFVWEVDDKGNLDTLRWIISEKKEIIYRRTAANTFVAQEITKQGQWREDLVTGVIIGSLNKSLSKVGLSQLQIENIAKGLETQIITDKIRKGTKFALLVDREYINNKITGVGNVKAIVLKTKQGNFYAIRAFDGRFYDKDGFNIEQRFLRYPFKNLKPRVSSPFNLHRIHPITHRLRPHKGTDFAVNIGTKVIAPADGKVSMVGMQPKGAGIYLKIKHGKIDTLYLHLSKVLVKVGDKVTKGQVIALSGNTGASTGPHLHYEFHIDGKPVDPMKVKLEDPRVMSDKRRKEFLNQARRIEKKLDVKL